MNIQASKAGRQLMPAIASVCGNPKAAGVLRRGVGNQRVLGIYLQRCNGPITEAPSGPTHPAVSGHQHARVGGDIDSYRFRRADRDCLNADVAKSEAMPRDASVDAVQPVSYT